MPIIQRNLFPRRPPTRKCDGPSVLKATTTASSSGSSTLPSSQSLAALAAAVNGQQPMPVAAVVNQNQTLVTTVPGFKKKSKDSSGSGGGGGSGFKISKMLNKDVKKFKSGKSASLSSLLVIGNDGPNHGKSSTKTGINGRKGELKADYHQFNSSTDCSSSDPLSLSSSCGSMDNPSGHQSHSHLHHNSSSALDSGVNLSDNLASGGAAGISRRKILSRSRDALNNVSDDYLSSSTGGSNGPMDEDVWFNKTKLISDHIEEIVTKWDQIDDEIWAKVICMERNRRVAKAYARAPILTVNGGDHGFDGHRIGLNGFKNPLRDKKIVEIKKEIDAGVKIRMDQNGNLLVKRMSKSDIYVVSFDKIDSFDKAESRKSVVLFDMKQFQGDLLREIKSSNPNPRSLEKKCFCFVSFTKMANELLNTPVWLIVINLVALEMLVKVLPNNKLLDDNFYSLPVPIPQKKPLVTSSTANHHSQHSNNNNNNNNNKFANSQHPNHQQHPNLSSTPPKLPPRDLHNKKAPLTLPDPDYDAEESEENENPLRSDRDEMDFQSRMMEDPYYFGLSAHVPKFAHNNKPQSAPQSPQTLVPPIPATSRHVNNPPIVRKKFWSQSANNFNFKFFTSNNNSGSGSSSSGGNSSSKIPKPTRNTLDYKSLPSMNGPDMTPSSQSMIYAQPNTPNANNMLSYSGYGYSHQQLMKSPPQYYSHYPPNAVYGNGSYPIHPAYSMMYNSGSGGYHHQQHHPSQYHYPNGHHYGGRDQHNAINQTAAIINDNNEIYGINTSLLRKNTNNQLYHRSNSSPALHHKYYNHGNNVLANNNGNQKDYNNNKNNNTNKNGKKI